jgi:hypothetical protein
MNRPVVLHGQRGHHRSRLRGPSIGERLRQEAYDHGDYYREEPGNDGDLGMTEEEFRARLNPRGDADGSNDAIVEDWRERKSRPVPVDPDTLLRAQPHLGTHSSIDMVAVSGEPEHSTVSPLTEAELRAAFGTVTPSAEQERHSKPGPYILKTANPVTVRNTSGRSAARHQDHLTVLKSKAGA